MTKVNQELSEVPIGWAETKIGYQGKAYLMIANAQNHYKRETTAALKQMPNIFLITETIGDFDVFAIAVIKTSRV